MKKIELQLIKRDLFLEQKGIDFGKKRSLKRTFFD